MENKNKTFVSDELSSVISNKWVFSVAPTIQPTDQANPYKLLDHNRTSMQLRLMPYSANGSGKRVVFNISWPMYDTLCKAVDEALMGRLGNWDMAVAYNDYLQRIFGQPDSNGRCPARVLTIRRDPVMQDGSKSRMPWYVEIKNGTGIKVATGTGGAFMKGGSFVENPGEKCSARLTDGQMKDSLYWGNKLCDLFFSAVKDSTLQGHYSIMQKKDSLRKSS